MMARGGSKEKKRIRCSNCLKLGHNKRNSKKCSRYFEADIFETWSSRDDDAAVTKAVNRIKRFIDKQPEILKEKIGEERLHPPLHWVAWIKCPLQVVQLIYEKYPEAIETTSNGRSPLDCAFSRDWSIQYGCPPIREDVIRFLIAKNPDLRTKKNRLGQLPLHRFCSDMVNVEASQETLDAMLLDCPETLWAEQDCGGNALNLCTRGCMKRGPSNLADMLRSKIIQYAREFKSKGKIEDFASLFKASCFDIPSLWLFKEEWPELLLSDLKDGARPLHIACMRYDHQFDNYVDHIQYLIKEAPAVMALQDRSGSTPLHMLLKSQRLRNQMEYLYSKPAHRWNIYYIFGHKHVLVQSILEANTRAFLLRDNEGFTPLLVSAQNDWPLTVIYSMLRTDPQLILTNSRFPGSESGAIDRKRKREN